MSATHSTSSSIEQVFHHFGQRCAALDYAFFKLNLPEHEVALQVDFIVRRRVGISQLRVSTYAPTGTGVSLQSVPDASFSGRLRIAGQRYEVNKATGMVSR